MKQLNDEQIVDIALEVIKRRKENAHKPLGYQLRFRENIAICKWCNKIRKDHWLEMTVPGVYYDS